MEATVVQTEKVQSTEQKKEYPATPHRFSRWADGDGKLWVVLNTWSCNEAGRNTHRVELLDVDCECVICPLRREFQEWVALGTLKKVETPILL